MLTASIVASGNLKVARTDCRPLKTAVEVNVRDIAAPLLCFFMLFISCPQTYITINSIN